jgi:hypothetical protein
MVLPDQSQLLEWLVVATSNFLLQEFLDDPQIGMLPVERHLYLHYIVGSRGGFDKVGYHGTSLVKQQLDLKTLPGAQTPQASHRFGGEAAPYWSPC